MEKAYQTLDLMLNFNPLTRFEVSTIRTMLKPKKRSSNGFALFLQENFDMRPKNVNPQLFMKLLGKEWRSLSEVERKSYSHLKHVPKDHFLISKDAKTLLQLVILQEHAKNLAFEHKLYNQLFEHCNNSSSRAPEIKKREENWPRLLSRMVTAEMRRVRDKMPRPPPISWVQYLAHDHEFGGMPEEFDREGYIKLCHYEKQEYRDQMARFLVSNDDNCLKPNY